MRLCSVQHSIPGFPRRVTCKQPMGHAIAAVDMKTPVIASGLECAPACASNSGTIMPKQRPPNGTHLVVNVALVVCSLHNWDVAGVPK
jgi:hypothetical protein